MPAPSPLEVATKVVQRLVKEEKSYHKELGLQEERVQKLKAQSQNGASEDGNREFILRQEEKAIEETRAVFDPLRKRIRDAVKKLEDQVTADESNDVPEEQMKTAKEALAEGKKSTTSV